jgi:magnesium transporter
LALGELSLKDWWFVVKREFLSGLLLGSILGLLGFARITFWEMAGGSFGKHWFFIALTVGTSLVGVVLWGTIVGSMLPLFLKKLNFDPAVSSAPFVATLVDVTGIIIYFSVAALLLTGKIL